MCYNRWFSRFGHDGTWDNNCSEEIKRRIGKATGAMASLKHVWNSKKMRIDNKLKILTTCVFSVLLYASETWTLKETDKKKLLAFDIECYRRILRINWRDMVRNEDIRKRKLGLFGHICRMGGKFRRGRPCREWLDDITEWCQCSGQELFHLAQDRRAWKSLIL